MIATLESLVPYLLAAVGATIVATATVHALLYKRDNRAAVGWLGVILLLPVGGALLYWALGINRVHRRAAALYRDHEPSYGPGDRIEAAAVLAGFPSGRAMANLMDRVSPWPLSAGNAIAPLIDGDEAYPAMLQAIDGAQRSIALTTYIFDRDRIGLRFADALAGAVQRGVTVRVLVDSVGARYSFPSILRHLRRQGVRAERFNTTLLPWRWTYANLRTHRKILVVDGIVGFTGGLNIRDQHVIASAGRFGARDLHFRVEGPVVAQMLRVFAEDWWFVTHERLDGLAWFPELATQGTVFARGITDGPDGDLDRMRWTLMGALTCATRRVRIVTPYFLPESDLIYAMTLTQLRGVQVEIVVPGRNNQALAAWACDAILPQILDAGCTVYKTTGIFDHAKLLVVDDVWVCVGSTNLDPRSLRLNFEFNIECYSTDLAATVHGLIDERIATAVQVTREQLERRALPVRLRNGFARLFIPYL